MAHVPTQLDYAQGPAWHRRAAFRRVAFAVVLLGLLIASLRWLGPAWDQARLVYWQSKCLGYAAPQGHAVIDGTKSEKAPACWQSFYALFSPPGRKDVPTVFLHELHKPDGTPRLVALEASHTWGTGPQPTSTVNLEYHVIAPGSLWSRAALVSNAEARPYFYHEAGDGQYFQILPGQPDPNDPSHFTINLRWKDRTLTLDGYLRPDDTILLEPRDRLERLQVVKY